MLRLRLSLLPLAVSLLAMSLLATPASFAQTPAPAGAIRPATATPPARHPAPGHTVPVVEPRRKARVQRPAARVPPPAQPAPPPAAEAPAAPPPSTEPTKGSVTGLPLPRFAALRTDDVNLRVGPGTRYQIDWVYHRRELPVQIEREFEVWRLVSDMDGIKGWVHQATLTGRRGFIIKAGPDQTLRRSASDTANAVAILKAGVVGRLVACAAGADWCQLQSGDYRGYLRRDAFWGSYSGEGVNN